MEKLTPENIRFIENYLKNSGVEYVDVRAEITDHVASEIEAKMQQGDNRGFYEIFKSYMLENKATLLKSLKKFTRQADKKVFRMVLKNLKHPTTLIFGTLLSFLIFKLDLISQLSVVWISFLFMLIGIAFFLYVTFGRGQKYSTLSRLVFWLGLLDYFVFTQFIQTFPYLWNLVFAALMVWMNVSAVKTLFELKHFYKKQFLIL